MIILLHTVRYLLVILGFFATITVSSIHAAPLPDNYACGGNVEKQAWALWDSTVKGHVSRQLVEKELLGIGDTYALYNFQTYINNLAAMAMRCERRERVNEISVLMERTYAGLTEVSAGGGRQWICRGGLVCNTTNKLINREVMLTSVQFLGMASQLANWQVTRPGQLSPGEARFVRITTEVVLEHLLRWGGERERLNLARLKASPADVKDGSPSLFYTDKDLWLVGIHANLAGILESDFGKEHLSAYRDVRRQTLLKRYGVVLVQLLSNRLTLEPVRTKEGVTVMTADISRGFGRLYADNRYAGYTSEVKPVVCESDPHDPYGRKKLKVLVQPQSVPIVDSVGWDFSHARRLVHVLDAVSRNRAALVRLYAIPDAEMPGPKLAEAFANQLALRVWNGDREYPLFSNFWGGANGWYRVDYDNGTGQCLEGTPPYGLSISFLTGGYISWKRYVPLLGILGQKIHAILGRSDERSMRFIDTYYSALSFRKSSKMTRSLNEIMFLPSLVGQ